MRILEVRDGFVKFEADRTIYLSSFILINGIEKEYIAQVIQLKKNGNLTVGYAKILFLYDGSLQNYDKTLPSVESEIREFTFDILNNSINVQNPIIVGKTLGNNINITIDESAFDKKMLVCVDEKSANNLIVKNLSKQFLNLSKKVVIIDTLGIINAKKFVAGIDFKLPLDTASLEFMYNDCLNDATSDSKSLIIDIFKDLSEYSKTVSFLPFKTLKTIVDDMVDKSHVFKLLVLKNKLAKFDKLGYFADNKQDADKLKNILLSKCIIVDISKLDNAFQNRYLRFIYESLSEDSQILLEVSNTISKKNIKDILSSNLATTFITHSKFKYLNDIKNVFDNFMVVPSITNNQVFDIYGMFLNALSNASYLIAGEATNYIPLVSSLQEIVDVVETKTNEIKEEDLSENQNDNIVSTVESDLSNEDEIEENNDVSVESSQLAQMQENTISEDKILENINEKSNDVINKATESLPYLTPNNMFSDEDDSCDDNVENDENLQKNSEIIESEDVDQSDIAELNESDLEEVIEESNDEILVPLSDSFETEVHLNEEIQDYTPGIEQTKEITLNDELKEVDIPEETTFENIVAEDVQEELPEQASEIDSDEEAIELDSDIDLDFDSNIEDNTEEQFIEPQKDDEFSVLPIANNSDEDLEEIVELSPDDINDNDIIVDLEDEKELDADIDEQVVRDVDKVFTTRKDDDILDSDLDFIDELNSDDSGVLEEAQDNSILEELSEQEENNGILEEYNDSAPILNEKSEEQDILETRNSSTPIVPVYDAEIPQEDLVMSDPIQQGDTVVHAKYGTGVVEKMIKYGNKTLFSINFDNIGRRLLDPTLTEIKKT